MAASTPRPTADHIHPALLALVGKIAIQSAYADFLIGELLGGLTGTPKMQRSKTIHALATRRKIEDIQKIIKRKSKLGDKSKLFQIISYADDLLDDRNLVIHGIIAYAGEQIIDPVYVAFRGKHVGAATPFSEITLSKILNDLDLLCRQLMKSCGLLKCI